MRSLLVKLLSVSVINTALSLCSLLIGFFLIGVNPLKDSIDLFTSLMRSTVAAFGMGSLGGAFVFIASRRINNSRLNEQNTLSFFMFMIAQIMYFVVIFLFYIVTLDYFDYSFIKLLEIAEVFVILSYFIIQPILDLFISVLSSLKNFMQILIVQLIAKVVLIFGLITTKFYGFEVYQIFFVLSVMIPVLYAMKFLKITIQKFTIQNLLYSISDLKDGIKLCYPFILLGPVTNIGPIYLYPIVVQSSPGGLSSFIFAQSIINVLVSLIYSPFSDLASQKFSRLGARDNRITQNQKQNFKFSFYANYIFRISLYLGILGVCSTIIISKVVLVFSNHVECTMCSDISAVTQMVMILSGTIILQVYLLFFAKIFLVIQRPLLQLFLTASASVIGMSVYVLMPLNSGPEILLIYSVTTSIVLFMLSYFYLNYNGVVRVGHIHLFVSLAVSVFCLVQIYTKTLVGW